MPVPSSITDLNTVASANSPAGSEPIGNNADDYLRAAFSFIAQLYGGSLNASQDLNANSHKVVNLAQGTNGTDAINLTQLNTAVATLQTSIKNVPKVGDIKLWHGAVANITSIQGPGWQLCDGTNGTADLRDRFVVGAGASYAPNNTGGANTVVLSVANMPTHNHGVNDPGHNHGVNDPGHAHGVYDPGHQHVVPWGEHGYNPPWGTYGASNLYGSHSSDSDNTWVMTSPVGTGIGIYGSGTGIYLSGSGTGVSIQNNGSGTAHENRPPYYALCYIEYTGIGV